MPRRTDGARLLYRLRRSAIKRRIQSQRFNVREYDLIAEWYRSERDHRTGVPEATALASSIPRGSVVLDVGCGNGIPITRALLSEGHRVVGLDSSSAMLAHFKRNCPEAFAVRGIVESCPFGDGVFDAAVAWGVMFHLNPEDAIRAIANVSRTLKRGAPFLFTSGDVDAFDAKDGTMNGVTFRYFSYSAPSYRRILGDCGCTLVDVHADGGKNTITSRRKLRRRADGGKSWLRSNPSPNSGPSGISTEPQDPRLPNVPEISHASLSIFPSALRRFCRRMDQRKKGFIQNHLWRSTCESW